jgi:hypothetical protein
MGILDTLLGRTKPVQSNLDALFALPSAAVTLQSAADTTCSGHAGVCFKPPTGAGFAEMQAEVANLLALDSTSGFHAAEDSFGYHWLVVDDADVQSLVTQVHLVNSSLADAGWGPQLLCSVFGLTQVPATVDGAADDLVPAGPGTVRASTSYLVYLFKRGTFYPFVPTGHEQRDIEQELRLKSLVAGDLAVEPDLERWFPLWDLPVG